MYIKYAQVWKLQYFSITQILREINFWGCKSAKSAIITHLDTLKFDFYEFLHFLKAENYKIDKNSDSRAPKMTKK